MLAVTERDNVTDRDVSVEAAVLADLAKWGDLAESGLAAVALSGARVLDDPDLTPTPRSMLMAQVVNALVKLGEMAAEVAEPEADDIDEVKRKRDERRRA